MRKMSKSLLNEDEQKKSSIFGGPDWSDIPPAKHTKYRGQQPLTRSYGNNSEEYLKGKEAEATKQLEIEAAKNTDLTGWGDMGNNGKPTHRTQYRGQQPLTRTDGVSWGNPTFEPTGGGIPANPPAVHVDNQGVYIKTLDQNGPRKVYILSDLEKKNLELAQQEKIQLERIKQLNLENEKRVEEEIRKNYERFQLSKNGTFQNANGRITVDDAAIRRQILFHEMTQKMKGAFKLSLDKTKAFASTGKGKLAIGGTVAAGGAAVGLALYNNKLKETSRVAFQKIDMAIQDHMMANREARKKLAFIKASQTNIMDSKKALFMKTIDDCNAYTTINETMLNNMRQMCQECLAFVGGFGATGVFAAFYTSVSPVVIERHKALLNIRTMANTAAGDVNVSKETADVINSLLMAEQKETAAMQAIFRQFSVECDAITSDIQKTTGADYNSLTPPPTPTPDPANPVVDSPALDLPQETPDTVKQNIMQNFWQSLSQSSATTKVMYGLAGAGILYGAYKLGQKLKQKWDERKQQKEKEMQEKEARANRDLEM